MIVYNSGMSKTKQVGVLVSIIKIANQYPGSISNKKVKKLINTILDDYPNPLYKYNGTTLIKNKGNFYVFKLK